MIEIGCRKERHDIPYIPVQYFVWQKIKLFIHCFESSIDSSFCYRYLLCSTVQHQTPSSSLLPHTQSFSSFHKQT